MMQTDGTRKPIATAAAEFLANKRIAVTGVSRNPQAHGSNVVYQRLRARGYEMFAVNPNTDIVEGDKCFPDLKSIPGGVGAVVLGIKHVSMHRSVDRGSVSDSATAYEREHRINVIPGGCPLMFEPVSNGAHKAMKFVFTLTGAVPRRV